MALEEYRKKIAELSEEEVEKRDIEYIMPLAKGELYGPPTGYASIDKPWLKYYKPSDISLKIPKQSIYQYMVSECAKYGDLPALECFGERISYNEFFRRIDRVATALVDAGVKKGDVVSVCLPNIPEVGYVFYAINKIGAVANMLDPRTNAEALGRSVNDAESKLLITLDFMTPTFSKLKSQTKLEKIVSVSPVECLPPIKRGIAKLLKKQLRVKVPKDDSIITWKKFIDVETREIESVYDENLPAIIAYTGGTTGTPKGVLMSNEAMNAMIIENQAVEYDIEVGDTCISLAPPWTYYGISNNFNVYLHLGICIKLIPEFGPDDLGKLIDKYKPNHVMTVPSALEAMKTDPVLQNADLSFVKTIIVGADRLDPSKEKEANDFLASHKSRCKISKGYGMTEVTAAATYSTNNSGNVSGAVGIPLVKENISVFNDQGEELTIGEKGNIHILGPKNMTSYFGENQHKNDEVFVEHGDGTTWVQSGDIGHMDENGNLYIDGRSKRMFTKAGFKIFASEVESIILQDERIAQCAVVAVENPSTGFLEKAYITIKEEYISMTEEILAGLPAFIRERTYEYEVPDDFEVLDKMPLTGMNKIDFKKLEEMAREMGNGIHR